MARANRHVGIHGIFTIPNIQGRTYSPGPQPSNPGESVTPNWPGAVFTQGPWPRMVETLSFALATNPGTPRARAQTPVNNQTAELLQNYMFLAGVVQKSKG